MQTHLQYAAGQPPNDPKQMPRYLQDEFQKLSAVLRNHSEGGQVVLHVAPPKPRAGMVVYADGSNWNPGAGEGLYRFSLGGAWVFVG